MEELLVTDDMRLDALFAAPDTPASGIDDCKWELIGGEGRFGSWTRGDGQERGRALAVFQGCLYAGIGAASAEVWRFDGESWERIGGQGVNGSWDSPSDAGAGAGYRPDARWVNALSADPEDKNLYAGVKGSRGAQLWRFDGCRWELAGGEGHNGDWSSHAYDHVYALNWHEGRLYAGMQGFLCDGDGYQPEQGNAEIFRFDGARWERVAGEGVNGSWDRDSAAMWVYELCQIEGILYAAIGRQGPRSRRWIGEVWQFADERWERVGGEGVRGSWDPEGVNLVTSLLAYQGKLVIGFNTPGVTLRKGAFGNVWVWDPSAECWHELDQPVVDADEELVSSQTMFNTSLVDRGHLAMGGGAPHTLGRLGLWTLDLPGNTWRCFARPGTRGFASPDDAGLWNDARYAYSMAHFRGDLILGVKGYEGTGHFWRCRTGETLASDA